MIIRAFSEDFEVRGDKETNKREFIVSTERKDSHNTILKMENKEFIKNN